MQPGCFYTHGQPYQGDRRSWCRIDTYHSTVADFDGGTDRLFCAGPRDESPIQELYDSRCSTCWLGFPHTQALHSRLVDALRVAQDLHSKRVN